jgi:PAS domain S-box-containing protein
MKDNSESSENILDAVLASMGEAVVIVNPDERTIVNCNEAAVQLFGYEKQELVGKKTRTLHIDQEHFERFGQISEPVLNRGEVFETEYRMKRKDGAIIDTYNTVSSIQQELGWEAGVVSIIRDITEQKEAERNLQNETRRLREAPQIGRLPDWYYEVDTGRISWSPMMYEIYERDPDLGPPRYEDLASYYQESSDYHDQMVQRANDEKRPYSFDIRIKTEKENERYIHVEGKPRENENGEVIKLYGIVQDITERNKALQREKRLKEVFYRALDMAPMPVLMRNEEGEITYMNQAHRRKTGFSEGEIQTVEDWTEKALHGLSKETLKENAGEVFSSDEVVQGGEFTVRTKHGEDRIWSVSSVNLGVLPGEDQQTAVVMAADVTELREAQDQMQLELSKFSQLFSHSPDAIAITDPDGRIVDVNRAFENLFGYNFNEVEDRNIYQLLTRNKEQYQEARQNAERLQKEEEHRDEVVRYTKDDEKVYVSIGEAAVKIEGEVQSLFHVHTDVTDRRKAEEAHRQKERELRTLFSNLPGMAYRCKNNRNYTMHFVSGGCKDLTGYEPAEVMNDNKVAYGELIHPEDQDYVWNNVQEALQNKSHFEVEYRIRTRKNEEKWVWERGTTLSFDEDDEIILQGFISDITERKQQKQKLEKLLAQKDTLIREIHHRVKNNMAIISGLLDLQKGQLTDPKAIEALQDSQLRIYTMANVHERLYKERDLTNIQSKDYIKNLLELHQEFYAGSNISLESKIQSFELNVNQAIPMGLLLNELITNACQHAFPENEEGVVTIRLELNGKEVRAEVIDNGRGMKDVNLETPESMGFTIINTLKKQLGASMNIDTGQKGTRVRIAFERMDPKGSASNLTGDFM